MKLKEILSELMLDRVGRAKERERRARQVQSDVFEHWRARRKGLLYPPYKTSVLGTKR